MAYTAYMLERLHFDARSHANIATLKHKFPLAEHPDSILQAPLVLAASSMARFVDFLHP
jgi:hypothetical protein